MRPKARNANKTAYSALYPEREFAYRPQDIYYQQQHRLQKNNGTGGLPQALDKLMVVVEKYPELKAHRNFRELQAQFEGTENRITVARNRHIEAIMN